MIEHAESPDVGRLIRFIRPTLARTRCSRWVDVIRLALRPEDVTCPTCRNRMAKGV